jgi:hypothetical protein
MKLRTAQSISDHIRRNFVIDLGYMANEEGFQKAFNDSKASNAISGSFVSKFSITSNFIVAVFTGTNIDAQCGVKSGLFIELFCNS